MGIQIESATTPGLFYEVGDGRCNCPAFRVNAKCKHLAMVPAAPANATIAERPDNPWAALRAPFPADQIAQLPKPYAKDSPKGTCRDCGGYHGLPAVHLDYVGHAEVTDRLLAVDPHWNWEPLAFGADGMPAFMRATNGAPVGLWIRLTVCGVSRLGFGSVAPGVIDPEKQLISDSIRNAAMRFGVALDLWSKSDRANAAHGETQAPDKPRGGAHQGRRNADELAAEAEPASEEHIPEWVEEVAALLAETGLRRSDLLPVFRRDFENTRFALTQQNWIPTMETWLGQDDANSPASLFRRAADMKVGGQ